MDIVTERSSVESYTDEIKQVLKDSQLNFCWFETPFSVNFNVKKKFFIDFSNPKVTCKINNVCKSSTTIKHTSPRLSTFSLISDSGMELENAKIIEEMNKIKC